VNVCILKLCAEAFLVTSNVRLRSKRIALNNLQRYSLIQKLRNENNFELDIT
jgi:hypothetical protein